MWFWVRQNMQTKTPQGHKPDGPLVGRLRLTRFQIDLLVASRDVQRGGEIPTGSHIRGRVADLYDKEVTHGQLYPNLDTLAENDLIERGTYDRRTNIYSLTRRGHDYLAERVALLNGANG